MKRAALVGWWLLGCGAAPSAPEVPGADACVTYHFTRVLPGSGTEASVAPDGSIVAVSELEGLRSATVLNREGTLLGSFALGSFSTLVRVASGGRVVAAAADGRVRGFDAEGGVRWTVELGFGATDLLALADGGAIVSGQGASGSVSYVDGQGRVTGSVAVRVAPRLAANASGHLVLTSRDACSADAPCGAGFAPSTRSTPSTPSGGGPSGEQTSAVVLLDAAQSTLGGFISGINVESPLGPLFIQAGLMGPNLLVVHASALSATPAQGTIDVDPGPAVALRDVDTEASPDHVLAFSGRRLLWDHGFEPLDDSGRAHVLALFASPAGVVVDVNGDVYKTHHIQLWGADGTLRLRYDKPNDGIANDVKLAGMDDSGRIVLSGRFEGAQDFDPGTGTDVLSASVAARRYITVVSACSGSAPAP